MSSAPRAGTRASKSTPSSGGASGGGRAQAKMDSLLAFLDEVETDTRVASSVVATPRDLERMSTASSHLGPSASMVGAGDDMGMAGMPPTVPLEPDTASRAGAVYDGVKARLMELTLENKVMQRIALPRAAPCLAWGGQRVPHALAAQDKSRTIAILKRQVGELREEQKRSSEASAQQLRDKLAKQKKKFEAEMARQLAFIDSLIADKEQLSKQCEALGDDVKAMEARMEARMKALAEQHAAELRRARDHWAAAEKVRREKWEAEKTREVKEMTIKGLEPEIQRILDKHREEKERLQRQQKVRWRGVACRALLMCSRCVVPCRRAPTCLAPCRTNSPACAPTASSSWSRRWRRHGRTLGGRPASCSTRSGSSCAAPPPPTRRASRSSCGGCVRRQTRSCRRSGNARVRRWRRRDGRTGRRWSGCRPVRRRRGRARSNGRRRWWSS